MEKALFISKTNKLNEDNLKGYHRLYFGQEFCEKLIPCKIDVDKAINICTYMDLGFIFVTPYATDKGIDELIPLLKHISEKIPGCEVVINDYGLLDTVNQLKLKPCLGRMLVKMKKEPRIKLFLDNHKLMSYYKKSNLDSESFRRFLKENNIHRAEFDNPTQGIGTDLTNTNIDGSLYYPYVNITTTRRCPSNSCDKLSKKPYIGIYPCQKECQKYLIKKHSEQLPLPVLIKGNSEFYENTEVPNNLLEKGINRLVYQLEIPI